MADLSFLDPQTTGEQQTESPLEAASPDLSFLDPGTSAPPSGPNPLIQARDLTSGMDPVKTAKVIDLSRKTGLPARVVEPNMPDLERQQVLSDQKLDTVHQLYPGTAQFLADPDAFAVAQHDIDGLTMLEGTISQYNPGVMERLGTRWEDSLYQMQGGVRGFVTGSLRAFLDATTPEYEDGSNWDSGLGRLIRGLARDALSHVESVGEQAKKGLPAPLLPADNAVQQYVEDFVGSAAPVAMTIAISAIGSPLAGASFMGTQIAGGDYNERVAQGADPVTAYWSGIADAAIQAPMEALSLGTFFKMFKTTGVGNAFKAIFQALGTEALTEALQEFPQDLTEALALADTRGQDLWGAIDYFVDNLDETVKNGLYAGLLSAPWALLGGAGHASREYVKAKASEREQAVIDAVTQGVQTSQLAQLDPLMFEQAVALMKQGSAVENIYIPAQAFAQMYSQNIEARAAAMDSLGITEEQLEAQASTGGDLVIPLEKYAKAVATVPDFAAAIANDRRLTADGYTRNEKAAFDEEMALNMQRAVAVARQEREVKDQFDAETKAIYEEALELRKAAGMVDNAAASDALGMAAAFTNIARMSEGQYTPQQLWEMYKPKVVGPRLPYELDKELDRLRDELPYAITEADRTPMENAIYDVTGASWSFESALNAVQLALENGRNDVIKAVIERAKRYAASMSTEPTVPPGSSRYDDIKRDMEERKNAAQKEAEQLERLAKLNGYTEVQTPEITFQPEVDPLDNPGDWANAELEIDGMKTTAGEAVNTLKQRMAQYEKLLDCIG